MKEVKSLIQYEDLCPGRGYPSLYDSMSEEPIPDKEKVLAYLNSGFELKNETVSLRHDVFTGLPIGLRAYYTDGEWEWTNELIYYFSKYNIQLPAEFIRRVLGEYEENRSLN